MDKNYQNSPFEIQDNINNIEGRIKNFEVYLEMKKDKD